MQYPFRDVFSTAQNSFWIRWFWGLLVLLPFFSPPLPHQHTFPFEDFLHPEKHKKVTRGETGWIRRMGHGGHAVFGQKLLNTQRGVGRCTRKSPIMKWANAPKEKSLHKHSLKLNATSHHNASWYTDTDVFLEHSPSRGSLYYKRPTLQKMIPVFWGPLSYIYIIS